MSNYQERVKKERNELDLKVNGLYAFVLTDTFHNLHDRDQELLNSQLCSMVTYLDILDERIERFRNATD